MLDFTPIKAATDLSNACGLEALFESASALLPDSVESITLDCFEYTNRTFMYAFGALQALQGSWVNLKMTLNIKKAKKAKPKPEVCRD